MRRTVAFLGVAVVALFFASTPAAAGVDGPCTVVADGQDLGFLDEVAVAKSAAVEYDIAANGSVTSWKVFLEVAGVSKKISEGAAEDGVGSVAGEANVSEYAWLGAGVYEVHAEAILADGSTCRADFLVHVEGNPFVTVLGATGTVLAVGGATGLGALVWLGLRP